MKLHLSYRIFWNCAIGFVILSASYAQDVPEMGVGSRPNYESYRMDKVATQGDPSYSGDLNLSLPIATVPGRHGHDFEIKINYNSNITQRQRASWVGLGWSLDFGAVERTVYGRADDQCQNLGGNYNLGRDGQSGYRAEKVGRLSPFHTMASMNGDDDQADAYNIIYDGRSEELLPFPATSTEVERLDPNSFLPMHYNNWHVSALWDQNLSIQYFAMQKQDGTMYQFGPFALDLIKVEGNSGLDVSQQYEFPNRWNLTSIFYPDGSKTTIQYDNSSVYQLPRPLETLFIDRSWPDDMGNLFGTAGPGDKRGTVSHKYSVPCSLYTDTHVAIFHTSSSFTIANQTERNCRLDEIIIQERITGKEIKRIRFVYATSSNDSPEYRKGYTSYKNWSDQIEDDDTHMLNDDQLTLVKIEMRAWEDNDEYVYTNYPLYQFTYYENPKTNQTVLADSSNSDLSFPGYMIDNVFATAWRLKNMKLLTGATIEYSYERFNNTVDPANGPFYVKYDPEGRDYNDDYFHTPWSFRAMPRCRPSGKQITDPINSTTQVWSYEYSPEVIYDPPTRPIVPNYWMHSLAPSVSGFQFYKLFRGCGIAHRWVKTINPDQSWKKLFYTSSYIGTLADPPDPHESCPDEFNQSVPIETDWYNIWIYSNAGMRGLVWKEISNLETSQSFYSYELIAKFKDKMDYQRQWGGLPSARRCMIEQRSWWPKLNEVVTVQDGVTSTIDYSYNPSERMNGNGLICQESKTLPSPQGTDIISTYYDYAFLKFLPMRSLGMKSQLYSTKISKKNSNNIITDAKKEWTTWTNAGGNWLPFEKWLYNYSDQNSSAPADPTNNDIRSMTYQYDTQGYADILKTTDANGMDTWFYYSDNTTAGLKRGLITGVKQVINGTELTRSFSYDERNNLIQTIGENGETTQLHYDPLGRIQSVDGPSSSHLAEFNYAYNDGTSPNLIESNLFRTVSDALVTHNYYDGLGYEIQKLLVNGNEDIISAITYDGMKRPSLMYKPYQTNTANHLYDPLFGQNNLFTRNEYTLDGRIMHQHAPGTIFQADGDDATGRYMKYAYGTNAVNEVPGYSESTLYKTTTTNENGTKDFAYKDILGNLVRTVNNVASPVTDANSQNLTTTFEYNVLGGVIKSKPPLGNAESVEDYNTTFQYNTLEQLTQKTSPDAGTVQYLYDKNGNLRFIKDANHTGAANSINCSGSFSGTTGSLGNFPMNLPGKVTLTITRTSGGGSPTLNVRVNGAIVASAQTGAGTTIVLPKNESYTYDVSVNGTAGGTYSITCSTGYEFVYNKYDALNRLIETGEYESSSPTNFLQENANSVDFPTSNTVASKTFTYDNVSTNPLAPSGQQNLKGKLSTASSYRLGSLVETSFYSYNAFGRTEWVVQKGLGSSAKKITYTYDLQGNMLSKVTSEDGGLSHQIDYTYDEAGRLGTVQSASSPAANYQYNDAGTVNELRLGNGTGLQTINYTYNSRDWLTQITSPNLSMTFGYNDAVPNGLVPTTQQFNGNISWMTYSMEDATFPNPITPTKFVGYTFGYDDANRLLTSNFGYNTTGGTGTWNASNAYSEKDIEYDVNGNIRNLKRYGETQTIMDELNYDYQEGNRLAGVTVTHTNSSATLIVTPSPLSFGNVLVGTSAQKSYSLSGTNLTPSGTITVTAPSSEYKVSTTSGSGFASSITVVYSGSSLAATPVYVQFIPTATQLYSGNITNTGGGAITKDVVVSGNGVSTAPPIVTITNISPASGTLIAPANATVYYTVNQNVNVQFRIDGLDGGGTSLESGNYEYALSSLSAGTHTIEIEVTTPTNGSSTATASYEVNAPYITVSPSSVSFGYGSESTNIELNSNVSWNISSNNSWIHATGSGDTWDNFPVSCDANTSTSSRSGSVTVSGGGTSATLYVTQAGAPPPQYTLTVTAVHGSVVKNPDQTSYISGTNIQLTATPNSGYAFINWTEGGTVVSINPSYTFTVSGNRTLVANFALMPTVTITSISPASGTQSAPANATVYYTVNQNVNVQFRIDGLDGGSTGHGSGDFEYPLSSLSAGTHTIEIEVTTPTSGSSTATASYVVNNPCTNTASAGPGGSISPSGNVVTNGNSQPFTITPNTGYHIAAIFVDGASVGTVSSLTVVGCGHTIIATFAINTYTLTVNATNGTVTKSPNQSQYDSASTVQLTATSDTGYHFTGWSGNASGSTNPMTITMDANKNITANFAINTYIITSSAGSHGTISPSGSVSVDYYGSQVYNITPDPCYFIADVKVDGESVDIDNSSITFWPVTKNYSLSVSFAQYIYPITASAGAGGAIAPTYVSANCGDNATFTITPNTGYHIVDVKVNGTSMGAVSSYTISNVAGDYNIVASFAINPYTLTYTAGSNGTISGTSPQTVNYGENGTPVTAVPNIGYHFVNWSDSSTNNPRTDLNVTANKSITANFTINRYTLTYIAGANGSITGTTSQTVTYGANGTAVTAVPDTGYRFLSWNDDVTTASRTDLNVASDIYVTAYFSQITYIITATAEANGAITQAGIVGISYGSNRTYTITPSTGYHVSNVLVDGSSVGAVTSYTFTNVTSNRTITASFAPNTYTITASAGSGGSISPGTTSVNYGSSQSFSISPNSGYHITNVVVDGSSVGAVSSYTFSNVTSTHMIYAYFTPNTYTITASAGSGGSISPGTTSVNHGSSQSFSISPNSGYHITNVVVDGSSVGAVSSYTFSNVTSTHMIYAYFTPNTYTITASAGSGGSISPGTTSVNHGSSQSFSISPNSGYHITNVVVDGSSVGAVSSYTFNSVTAAHSITASFAINTYTISASASSGGSISPGTTYVNHGSSQSFSISPNSGYHITNVVVDGSSVGAVSSYTFNSVTAAHSISASFAINTYTISASAGSGGSISPGTTYVNHGSSQSFSISPNSGYHITNVVVDGSSVGAVSSYTFSNVTSAHMISAYFEQDVQTFTISASANIGGTFSPGSTVTVDQGGSLTISFEPIYPTYFWIYVNGALVTAGTDYTVTNVTSNMSIYFVAM